MTYAAVRYGGYSAYTYDPATSHLYRQRHRHPGPRHRQRQRKQRHPTVSPTPRGTTGQLTFTNGTIRNNNQDGIQAYRDSGTIQVRSAIDLQRNGANGASDVASHGRHPDQQHLHRTTAATPPTSTPPATQSLTLGANSGFRQRHERPRPQRHHRPERDPDGQPAFPYIFAPTLI